jgi:hypothetical protein
VVPLLALVVLGYTVHRNVVPYPTGDAFWLPIVCTGWSAVAVVVVVTRPAIARRAGERLTADEGLGAVSRQERV